MDTRNTHVAPAVYGGWMVFRTGARRATRNFKTEKEALTLGRAIAKKNKATLFIHRDDGSVRKITEYGAPKVPH
ncbi:DUF2188 domain-containing protein [Pseudoduganella sp. FT26W]|uniref:DUF2188 domain-containing protein n=1 Tax=Duganella aquatilis TaxID=2666082 RepID=A0A844CR05_9BURK|nr:DUF2188 domain-containing protein [Duganella aquatilis]MRW83177.1 DUF2188 domain-containing protein [Duganella aquatilis]